MVEAGGLVEATKSGELAENKPPINSGRQMNCDDANNRQENNRQEAKKEVKEGKEKGRTNSGGDKAAGNNINSSANAGAPKGAGPSSEEGEAMKAMEEEDAVLMAHL